MNDLFAQAQGAQAASPQGGKNPQEIKQNILMTLEQKGVFEEISPKDKENLMLEVDKLVQAITAGDQNAIQQSPIMQLIAAQPMGGTPNER